MKAYIFSVLVCASELDCEVTENVIEEALADALPDGIPVHAKHTAVKSYSEQGWKVARAKLLGKTVKDVGDGHNAVKAGKVIVTANPDADSVEETAEATA